MEQVNRKIVPAVNWHCANPKCNAELGVAQQLGRRDRKMYCLKCADIIKGVRDERGIPIHRAVSNGRN